jgi:hypothetical protein
MGSRRLPGAARLEGSLLALSRDAKRLATVLVACLPPATRKRATQIAGLPPYVGPAGPRRMAGDVGRHTRLRAAVAAALLEALPTTENSGATGMGAADGGAADQLSASLEALPAADDADVEAQVSALVETHFKRPRPARNRTSSSKSRGAKTGAKAGAAGAGAAKAIGAEAGAATEGADALRDARRQLTETRKEKAALERKLAEARRANVRLTRDLEAADAKSSAAEQRAAGAKKKLADAGSASQRETRLRRELKDATRDRDLADKKLALISEERDDLRAQLEDLQRFATLADEVVPSFRDKPLLPVERDLGKALAAHDWQPRILVVGGGEPQRRHLEKFDEYADAVGFKGAWRLADYVSWHKAIDKLGEDMKRRFDALVILHWNRTTFTRKAREACNVAGQKPCITCHYEGFTSLRETLQECLRQLLATRGDAAP